LNEITHQHFLACTWLSFWCVEEQGPANWPLCIYWLRQETDHSMPRIFNELLDRMVLSFEISFDEYRQSRQDHLHEGCCRRHLFRVVVRRFFSQKILKFPCLTHNPATHGACSVLAQSDGFRGCVVQAVQPASGLTVSRDLPRCTPSDSAVRADPPLVVPSRFPPSRLGSSVGSCAIRGAHGHRPHPTNPNRRTRYLFWVPALSGFVSFLSTWGGRTIFH
jgi:hypothetical protein